MHSKNFKLPNPISLPHYFIFLLRCYRFLSIFLIIPMFLNYFINHCSNLTDFHPNHSKGVAHIKKHYCKCNDYIFAKSTHVFSVSAFLIQPCGFWFIF